MPETIFELLRESHAIQRTLIRRLRLSKPGPQRLTLFTELGIELASHEAAEERYLYTQMLMDDRGLHASRDALSDHHKMDMMVEDMQVHDHSGAKWMATLRSLSTELHKHLREEETIFFQLAGKILTPRQKTVLAGKYLRDYRRTRKMLSSQ